MVRQRFVELDLEQQGHQIKQQLNQESISKGEALGFVLQLLNSAEFASAPDVQKQRLLNFAKQLKTDIEQRQKNRKRKSLMPSRFVG